MRFEAAGAAVRDREPYNKADSTTILVTMRRKQKRLAQKLGRGALAGALGGLAGAWTMSCSAALWDSVFRRTESSRSELMRLEARRFVNGSGQELDLIGKAADWVDSRVFRRRLSPTQKGLVAALAHYATGASLGAVYGALAEVVPAVTRGVGVPFGVTESLAIESVGLSLAGVTRPLNEYRLKEYAQSAVDHAVYAATLEGFRRALRSAW